MPAIGIEGADVSSFNDNDEENAISEFQTKAKAIGKFIFKHSKKGVTEVISHHDADGISAAGIIGNLLINLNVPFHISIIKQLDETRIDYIEKHAEDLVIFTDLASSKIQSLENSLNGPFVILDHHEIEQPIQISEKKTALLNPHLFGIDGSSGVSGAGVAYFVAKLLNEKNIRLAPLAIIGATGDRQNKGISHSFTGLNYLIIEEAKKNQIIEEQMDLWVYGATTIPIVTAIERLGIAELSGIEIQHYLEKELQISPLLGDEKRTIADLTRDEKRNLGTRLIIDFGVEQDQIFRNVYSFPNEIHPRLKGAVEFATLLNALGRTGHYGVALALVFGDRNTNTIQEAENLHQNYSRKLGSYLKWASLDKIDSHTYNTFYLLNAGTHIDDRVIGTIASILVSRESTLKKRPLLAIAQTEEGNLKISCRISQDLVENISLASCLRKAMDKVIPEGEVGGHDAAAGASITKEHLKLFLVAFEDILSKQAIRGVKNSDGN